MYNRFAKEFGKRLRATRKRYNYSLEDVAYWAGISKGFLGKIERGEQTTTLKNLFQISRGLNITLKELFEFDDLENYTFERKD